MLFRGQAHEFLVRVHDSHVEGASGHVIAGPLDLHDVVADFRRVVATENRSVLLTFPLHFHSKGALGSSDAYCQLSRAGAFRFADESALIIYYNILCNFIYFIRISVQAMLLPARLQK